MGAQRILIADGDEDSRAVYRILLTHHGYEVCAVTDGAAALSEVRAGGVALVLTELALRGLDGHDLLVRLKADSATSQLPVIVATARGVGEDRARAEEAGCDCFLVKPIQPQRILQEVRRLTGEGDVRGGVAGSGHVPDAG